MSEIQLITRADDAGSCRSANEAILEGVEAGIIKNVSFLAVGPDIEHAVEILGGRNDIAYGFHVCLNAEWEDVKWGPLLPSSALTDANGNFLPFPNDTKEQLKQIFKLEDVTQQTIEGCAFPELDDYYRTIMSEVDAQLERLRNLGLPISYLDEHMGIGWIGFRDQLAELCRTQNIVDYCNFAWLPDVEFQGDQLSHLEARIKASVPAKYVWVTHPGKDEPDMQAFNLVGQPKGVVAKERDAERRLLTDPRLPELFEKWKVKAVRYDEI